MHLVKRFLKILLEELNKLDNNSEESGELLGQKPCPPGQRYLRECNKCVCASGKSAMVTGASYEQGYLNGRCIEAKNCKGLVGGYCDKGKFYEGKFRLVSKSCSGSTVKYKECECAGDH